MDINGKKISKQKCPNGPPCQPISQLIASSPTICVTSATKSPPSGHPCHLTITIFLTILPVQWWYIHKILLSHHFLNFTRIHVHNLCPPSRMVTAPFTIANLIVCLSYLSLFFPCALALPIQCIHLWNCCLQHNQSPSPSPPWHCPCRTAVYSAYSILCLQAHVF